MKNKNGYTALDLIIVIVVLGVITFFVIGKNSYAFEDHTEEYYQNKLNLILDQAEKYGETIKEQIQKDGEVIVSVNELVVKKFMGANENGKVEDPRDTNKDLNDRQIILKIEDGKVKGSFVS